MSSLIEQTLLVLQNYFVYLYPGIITIFVYRFIKGWEVEENKNLVIKAIVISYLYVLLLQQFIYVDLIKEKNIPISFHVFLILISIILPYLWWKFLNFSCFKCVMKRFGISTNIYDNPLDIIRAYESSVWLKVYLEDGVRYSGYLRNYVSELERARYMMLSQYRVAHYSQEKNVYEQIYPIDDGIESKKDWVILDKQKIIRIEVMFNEEH